MALLTDGARHIYAQCRVFEARQIGAADEVSEQQHVGTKNKRRRVDAPMPSGTIRMESAGKADE